MWIYIKTDCLQTEFMARNANQGGTRPTEQLLSTKAVHPAFLLGSCGRPEAQAVSGVTRPLVDPSRQECCHEDSSLFLQCL